MRRWPARLGCARAVLLGLLLTSACAAKEPPKPAKKELGATCRVQTECISGACADRRCVPVPGSGDACGMHAKCSDGTFCHRSAVTDRLTYRDDAYEPSATYGDICLTADQLAERDRVIQAKADRELLEKSGIDNAAELATAAEQPAASEGPGLPVRVVRTQTTIEGNAGRGFAACRSDERLTGGSCNISRTGSGPTMVGKTDTVGARWSCEGRRGELIVAIAMCQKLPAR